MRKNLKKVMTLLSILILVVTIFLLGAHYSPFIFKGPTKNYDEIIYDKNFSKESLIGLIKKMNFKHPCIVLGQSILETGHFKSKIFIENNNLFGMKKSSSRITMSDSIQNGHAYYDNWEDSVYDYALYQSTYLRKIKSEEEYFNYLSRSYAESDEYVKLLKQIIKKEGLKELF
jgi:uncharacterized FlgJ-related protein